MAAMGVKAVAALVGLLLIVIAEQLRMVGSETSKL